MPRTVLAIAAVTAITLALHAYPSAASEVADHIIQGEIAFDTEATYAGIPLMGILIFALAAGLTVLSGATKRSR